MMTPVVSEDQLAAEAAAAEEPDDIELAEGTPQSPLDILKGKRAQIQAKLHIDLAVPRWEDVIGGTIWVRYAPANLTLWSNAQRKREEGHLASKRKGQPGDANWAVKANADVLVDSCRGVYFLEPGEQPPKGELPADLPLFSDRELSEVLDYEDEDGTKHACPRSAVGTCMFLYGTDGDLLMAANALLGFSGEASREVDADFLKD